MEPEIQKFFAQNEIQQLWDAYWNLVTILSVSGAALFSLVITISVKLNNRVTHQYLEKKFVHEFKEEIIELTGLIKEIKETLLGDFKNPDGFIENTRAALRVMRSDVEELKRKLDAKE